MGVVNPLDDAGLAGVVFFPRPDLPFGPRAADVRDHLFDLASGPRLRLRVYPGPAQAPAILFFHGNGETGRDYDPIAAAFTALPATLIAAEYRGYGPCTGRPSLSNFLDDAHASLDEARRLLEAERRSTRIVVMGRSLGSAPAIELAARRGGELAGLIVESGFSRIVPLLELLGLPAARMGITEAHGPRNLEKIGQAALPTLIMHAENDMIIPVAEAADLFAASADPGKVFVRVPRAGHNDIQLVAGRGYFDAMRSLLARIAG
jgi:alpha-beta hydrolase superfamily lysophospholipase